MSWAWMALASAALAAGPEASVWAVDSGKSTVGFQIVHKLHKVQGESRAVQGKAVVAASGDAQVMVRVAVASFASGDANRDGNMRETLDAAKFPYATFKAVGKLVPPRDFPARGELLLEGELDFHGRKRPEKVPVALEWSAPGALRAKGHFSVSLDRYEVERPSLLFIKIDDACEIDVDFALAEQPR